MIKIISGVYGYLDKNGCVKPKTEKDEPFTLSEDQEDRLVGLGVAKYVNTPETVKEPETEADEMPELPEGVVAIPEYSEDMSAKELREIGKLCGLSFKVGMTKKEMVEALDAEIEGHMVDDEEQDDEPVPTFDAAEAVE